MIHHSNPNKSADSTGVGHERVRLRNEPKPPWLVLLVGFFFIDGLFGTLAVLLWLPQVRNLLHILPPFSFMGWYAYEDPWGWGPPIKGFLYWTTPILELAVGWSIWRTPARTQRLVFIVGAALALLAGLEALVPIAHISQGDVWYFGRSVGGLAELALAVFAIWFVRRFSRLARPEATLLSAYLVLTGLASLAWAIDGVVDEGISKLLSMLRPSGWWLYLLARSSIVEVLSSSLLMIGGLLLKRAHAPIRAVCTLLVLACVLNLGMWLLRVTTGMWGPFLSNAIPQLRQLCPIAGSFGIVLALAWFACRNVHLFSGPEPFCRTCRYNLTGNVSGVCPECGTPIDPAVVPKDGASPARDDRK